MRAIRITAVIAAILTYGLIVLGALVRSTNSGLSCPDWPTCYGQWVLTPADFAALPDTGYTYTQVMLEWGHRLVAGVMLGPLILLLFILTQWRRRAAPGIARAGIVLVLLLLVQGGLGGVTVLDQNSPWSVALHLGNALLVLSTILFIAVHAARMTESPPAVGRAHLPASGAVMMLAGLAWVVMISTMITAAITAKSGAALACSTWPLCDGAVIPDLADPQVRIHFAHRLLAATTAVVLLLLAVATWASRFRAHALLALVLVACQVGLGALVIVLKVPTWNAVLHQSVGVLTFALLTLLVWRTWAAAAPRRAPTIGERRPGYALRRA